MSEEAPRWPPHGDPAHLTGDRLGGGRTLFRRRVLGCMAELSRSEIAELVPLEPVIPAGVSAENFTNRLPRG